MRETVIDSSDSNNAGSKELVSIKTLSNMLDMKERTIREKVATRKIPYYKLGKLIRFDIGEIRGWYRSSRVESLTPDIITDRIL